MEFLQASDRERDRGTLLYSYYLSRAHLSPHMSTGGTHAGDLQDVRRVKVRWLQDAWGLILLRFRAGKEESRVENETAKERLGSTSSVPSAKVTASLDTRDQRKARAFGASCLPNIAPSPALRSRHIHAAFRDMGIFSVSLSLPDVAFYCWTCCPSSDDPRPHPGGCCCWRHLRKSPQPHGAFPRTFLQKQVLLETKSKSPVLS